ncbi:hypothetical protein [Shewanella benthica]|uniref:Uncharacterized protein n=1 Tax=Shewanella benthica KT99 TaxID=314608 RepID=A9CW99_9GAMM|nr:hypothetical protein [Shewanella benthica]EDQ02500.1 hypothetical protein KT99_18322 [Shewanella benthica KT99]
MKYIAIILLVALGIYLYKRAKRLAEDEQEQSSMPAEKEIFDEPKADDTQETDANSAQEARISDAATAEIRVDSKAEERVTEEKTAEPTVEKTESQDVEIAKPVDEGLTFETKDSLEVKEDLAPSEPEPAEEESKVARVAVTDESWANEKLTLALSEYRGTSDNTLKHVGLLGAIAECYKQRKQTQYKEYGAALSPYYLSLFAVLESPLSHKGIGFMHLSTLLNDCGEFASAIDVCRKAIEYDLSDGTVTGFEGRIIRIEKAKAKSLK